jgi:hypothetical protein
MVLVIAGIVLILYCGILGYSVDNRFIDIIANFTISISIFIWIYIDAQDKDIFFSKVQNFLFVIPLTNPFLTIWYLIKTRNWRTGFFYLKLAVYVFAVFLIGIIAAILVAFISARYLATGST